MNPDLQWRAFDARDTLRRHPEIQAARIVAHYRDVAAYVGPLNALLKNRDAVSPKKLPETDAAIDYLVQRIREQHYADFGILLDWT